MPRPQLAAVLPPRPAAPPRVPQAVIDARVRENQGIVHRIARQMNHAGFDHEDLVSEGNVGILIACQKFDPAKEVKFSTYAAWWIRARILRFVLDNYGPVRIGTTRPERRVFFNSARLRHAFGFNGPIAAETLAERLNVDVDFLLRVESFKRYGESLDITPAHKNDDRPQPTRKDLLPDESELFTTRLEREDEARVRRASIERAMSKLSRREQRVVRRRYLVEDPATLQEIGDEFGVSRERVRQIERVALLKLRGALGAAGGKR